MTEQQLKNKIEELEYQNSILEARLTRIATITSVTLDPGAIGAEINEIASKPLPPRNHLEFLTNENIGIEDLKKARRAIDGNGYGKGRSAHEQRVQTVELHYRVLYWMDHQALHAIMDALRAASKHGSELGSYDEALDHLSRRLDQWSGQVRFV